MRIPRNERLGSDITGSAPERKCILSGEHAARHALVRLAVSPVGPDGSCTVLPDVLARAPGRGAWIGVCASALENAVARGKLKGALAHAFGKSLGGARIVVPDDLAARMDAALMRAFTDRLGLELKSGRLLMGSDRIAESARAGKVAWLAHAADASPDGARKLDQAWRVGNDAEGSGKAGIRLPLDRAALSVALGRDNVVHLALTDAAAAERVSTPLQRLLHFRGDDPQGRSGPSGSTHANADAAAPGARPDAVTTPDSGRAR